MRRLKQSFKPIDRFCARNFLRMNQIQPVLISLRRAGLSGEYNRSLGSANTRQYISGVFLLSRQPGFNVHLNVAAQDSRGARSA
jgi:hypothetical protein